MVLYLASETQSSGVVPTEQDLAAYAEQHFIQYPVLSDPAGQIGNGFSRDGYIPSVSIIDRGMVVHMVDEAVNETYVVGLL